jgi:hypothetical protein
MSSRARWFALVIVCLGDLMIVRLMSAVHSAPGNRIVPRPT